MLSVSTIWGIYMQFTVIYEDGMWSFRVESTGEEDEYLEEFEIDDLAEAKAAVQELVEEIQEIAEDEELDRLFGIRRP